MKKMIFHLLISSILLLLCAQLTNCMVVNIGNVNVIQNQLISREVIVFITVTDSNEMHMFNDTRAQMCFTINGHDCECFNRVGTLDIVPTLSSACIRTKGVNGFNEDHYWFGVTVSINNLHRKEASERNIFEISSYPIYVSSVSLSALIAHETETPRVTLVLPLTLVDVSRSLLLLKSLRKFEAETIRELLVFVPDSQYDVIYPLSTADLELNFPIRVIKESILFSNMDVYARVVAMASPYAIQMSVKLLASRLISTAYYLTLDADCLLLTPWKYTSSILIQYMVTIPVTTPEEPPKRIQMLRGLYDHEPRVKGPHPDWWDSSEAFLGLPPWEQNKNNQGFSVTPAILSTYGSLLTLNLIEKQISSVYDSTMDPIAWFVISFGKFWEFDGQVTPLKWTEYTLYRIALDYYHVFDNLHTSQQSLAVVGEEDGWAKHVSKLHCYDIWYSFEDETESEGRSGGGVGFAHSESYKQAQNNIWKKMENGSKQLTSNDIDPACVFSVIQSHSKISLDVIASWTKIADQAIADMDTWI